jgi:hypothetical protein
MATTRAVKAANVWKMTWVGGPQTEGGQERHLKVSAVVWARIVALPTFEMRISYVWRTIVT